MSETFDSFLGGKVRAYQPKDGFRAGTDTVFLAASIPAQPKDHILELGCGSGIGLLCLSARVKNLYLTGLELNPDAADRARRNFARAKLNATVENQDIFTTKSSVMKDQYDHVMMNPPFFDEFSHSSPENDDRASAHILKNSIGDWVRVGLKRVRAKGTVTIIFPTQGLQAMISAIPAGNAIKILPIQTKENEAAKRILVQVKAQSRAQLKLLSPLRLYSTDGIKTGLGESIAMGMSDINWIG